MEYIFCAQLSNWMNIVTRITVWWHLSEWVQEPRLLLTSDCHIIFNHLVRFYVGCSSPPLPWVNLAELTFFQFCFSDFYCLFLYFCLSYFAFPEEHRCRGLGQPSGHYASYICRLMYGKFCCHSWGDFCLFIPMCGLGFSPVWKV